MLRVLLLVLLVPSLASAQWLSDERGILANPDAAAMSIGYLNGLRAKLGAPLPLHRGDHGGATIRTFFEVHEDSVSSRSAFPFAYWRGFLSLGGHVQLKHASWVMRTHLSFEHESDHQTVNARSEELDFIYMNAAAVRFDAEYQKDDLRFYARAGFRYHIVSCTTLTDTGIGGCPQRMTEDSHGAELAIDIAGSGPLGSKLQWTAAAHAGWLPGRADLIEERRALLQAGIGWRAFGSWHLVGVLWAGNAVGNLRENRDVWVGFRLLYTPWANRRPD